MKIAHVIQNLECGGDVAMAVGLTSQCAVRGHEVHVLCLDRPTGSAHERQWLDVLKRHQVSTRFLGRRTKYPGLVAAMKIWWLIQRQHYEIVHSHLSMPDAIVGLVRRVTPVRFKHVLTVHNTREPRSRVRRICASGANVVYCSATVQRQSPLVGSSHMVIPNGVDQEQYIVPGAKRVETRRNLGVQDDVTLIVAVGRICAQKNFESAINAISMLDRRRDCCTLRLLICGEGTERQRLEARVKQLNLSRAIAFLGDRTDLPVLFAASDVFLSVSLYEGMPLAVLEALAAGLPCVLSSIDEHYEIARTMPGCAFAPPTSSKKIASAIQSLRTYAFSRDELIRARAPVITRFSIDNCAASYLSLYSSLCGA